MAELVLDAPRTVDHGRYALARPWPLEVTVQGGSRGVVLGGKDGERRTAFVEVFPLEPQTFIRGEGATVAEAEESAWAQYQRVSAADHDHEYEARGYRNGAGFCRHCNLFTPSVFTPEEIGSLCAVCGVGTFWTAIGKQAFCKEHTPSRQERARLRHSARDRGERVSELEALFDELGEDDDGRGNADRPHTRTT